MSFVDKAILIGLGAYGLSYFYNQSNAPAQVDPQKCVVKDSQTSPVMMKYINKCNFNLNTFSCVKYLADDAIEIFSQTNRKNCTQRNVEPNGLVTSGNLYDKNAGWLWNSFTLSEVRIFTCRAPSSPQNISGTSFDCK